MHTVVMGGIVEEGSCISRTLWVVRRWEGVCLVSQIALKSVEAGCGVHKGSEWGALVAVIHEQGGTAPTRFFEEAATSIG